MSQEPGADHFFVLLQPPKNVLIPSTVNMWHHEQENSVRRTHHGMIMARLLIKQQTNTSETNNETSKWAPDIIWRDENVDTLYYKKGIQSEPTCLQ